MKQNFFQEKIHCLTSNYMKLFLSRSRIYLSDNVQVSSGIFYHMTSFQGGFWFSSPDYWSKNKIAQSAEAVEYTDWISAGGGDTSFQ